MAATIFKTLHGETKSRILATLKARIQQAIQTNETLRWDSLLSCSVGFVNCATQRVYKGMMNQIFLFFTSACCNGDPRFLTFNQMKELSKGKGRVKAGSSLTPVFCPILKTKEDAETTETKEPKQVLVGYRVSYVANVQQTNLVELGILPEKWMENINKDSQPIEAVLNFASRIPFVQTTSQGCPYYSPSTDKIGMPPFEHFHNNFGHAESLCHELIHWTGADGRLDRNLSSWSNKIQYSKEELVACLGSAFLLNHLGVELGEGEFTNASAYLKNWLGYLGDDVEFLLEAAADATKSISYLIELSEGKKQAAAA
jgi:antirestriction protein ArdC